METNIRTDLTTDLDSDGKTDTEILEERYALAVERLGEIAREKSWDEKREQERLQAFFVSTAAFLLLLDDTRSFIGRGGLDTAPLEELSDRNRRLYEDILPENYEKSYANPAYAVRELGEEYGGVLSALYAMVRGVMKCLSSIWNCSLRFMPRLYMQCRKRNLCPGERRSGK